MTGDQNRNISLLRQRPQHIAHLRNSLRIQSVDRLIQHQKIRISDKCQCNAKPLLHSQRKMTCLFPADIPKTNHV